jgi:hypothetical protein
VLPLELLIAGSQKGELALVAFVLLTLAPTPFLLPAEGFFSFPLGLLIRVPRTLFPRSALLDAVFTFGVLVIIPRASLPSRVGALGCVLFNPRTYGYDFFFGLFGVCHFLVGDGTPHGVPLHLSVVLRSV